MTRLAGQGARSRAEAPVLQRDGLSDYVYEKAMGYDTKGRRLRKSREVNLFKKSELSQGCKEGKKDKKMLKMKDEPTMSMKTQGRATRSHVAEGVFHKGFSENRVFWALWPRRESEGQCESQESAYWLRAPLL